MRRQMTVFAAVLLLLAGCHHGTTPPEPGPGPAPETEVRTNLVLRSAFAPFESDVITDIEMTSDGIFTVSFLSGGSIAFDNFNHGYVTVGADDYLYVNGHRSDYKYIGIPYYTVGADGFWYKDGEATRERATPANFDAASGDVYLVNALDGPRKVRFQFSDGSVLDIPRERRPDLYVSKSASRMEIYVSTGDDGNFLCYPFYKRYRTYSEGAYPSFYDNWGMGAVELHRRSGEAFSKTAALFLNGEAEMAINVPRADNPSTYTYVGGTLHGFEQIVSDASGRALSISIDGQSVEEGSSFSLKKAGTVEMTQKSLLYQSYSNSDPWAEVSRRWSFEDGDLHISVSVKLLRDMSIKQAQFGMLCVLRRWLGSASNNYLTRYAIKDNLPFNVFDVSDGWQTGSPLARVDAATSRITEYGERGLSFALVIDNGTRKEKGGMFCGTNGNAYNKIYCDLTGAYEAKAGEILSASVHWEIDTIR